MKPTQAEIRALAQRETDPTRHHEFSPITRGPIWAGLALAAIGLAASPVMIWRAIRGLALRATRTQGEE